MAQDTTGTSLTTTAAATSRQPCMRFWVDWADYGFTADYATYWTNETAYVLNVQGAQMATDWTRSIAAIGRGVADSCTVTCQNYNYGTNPLSDYNGFRFSASNTRGPLYAYISSGIHMVRAIVECGFIVPATATPEYLHQITGYIVDASENYDARTITFSIRDRAADCAMTKRSTPVYTGVTAQAYMQTLAATMGRDPVATADQQFDYGMIVTPYVWCDDDLVWAEMGRVAEAQLGRIWFDKDGDLHFDDGAHFVKPSSSAWDDPTTSQVTLTVDSFRDCSPVWDVDAIRNHIIVEYAPRYEGIEQIVYSAADTPVVFPASSLVHKAEFRYPILSVVTQEADTDYVACTSGGTDITDSITITRTDYASHSELTIANADTLETAFISKLQIRGVPLLTGELAKYETENATSIAKYGRRTLEIRNAYIQTYEHAQLVGDFMLSRFYAPVMRLRIRGIPARPWLEPGDLVTVTETLTGMDHPCFIGNVQWTYSPSGGYRQDLELMLRSNLFPYTDYFILGTSTYGKSGRLFW